MSQTDAHQEARQRLETAVAASRELIEIGRRLDPNRPFLVGGAVRDLLLDLPLADIDVVIEGDSRDAANRLADAGGDAVTHPRFNTATCEFHGRRVDIAGARRETYPGPGALPDIEPAAIADDLARRDFSLNAMAVSLDGDAVFLDPCGGLRDLEARSLRVLHDASFRDDPTRVIRGARYAVRLELTLDPATAELLDSVPFEAVSADRLAGELRRAAAEARAPEVLRTLAEWGAITIDPPDGVLDALAEVIRDAGWAELASGGSAAEAMLVAARVRCGPYDAPGGPLAAAQELAARTVVKPSEGVSAADAMDPIALLLARALGATWLDEYLKSWRSAPLVVDASDLIAAGVPRGPDLSRALAAARRAMLDGEARTRQRQLETALAELRR